MTLKNYLLFFVCIIALIPLCAQDNVNLDDYILDTIIEVSPTDPTVIDTLIVARKKVVVKKEVVVEQVQEIPFIFTDNSIILSYGGNVFMNKPSAYKANDYSVDISHYTNGNIRASIYSHVLGIVSASMLLQYNWEHELVSFQVFNRTSKDLESTQTIVLDTFYVGTDTLVAYGEEPIATTISQTDTSVITKKNKRKELQLAITVGKQFSFEYFSLSPELLLAVHIPVQYITYRVENGTAYSYAPNKSMYVSYGLQIKGTIPISKRVGVAIMPSIVFFNKKNTFASVSNSVLYGINGGLYVRF